MQKQKEKLSLTEGPIGKSLLKFALPVILSMLTAQLTTLVDTMIVGLKMDANALAAVSNAATLLMFFLFISGGMELAAELLVAARKPLYSRDELSELVYNLLFVDVVIGILMIVIGLAIFRPLLILINTPEEIVDQAMLYGIIYLCGIPFQMVYDLSRQILIGYGNSSTPMYFALFTSVLNIVLDLILVDPLGVAGAALASVLAQVSGFVISVLWLGRHLLTGRFRFSMLKKSFLKDIARLAPPNAVQQLSGPIVSSIKQSLLGTIGVAAIAGFSCANKISTFVQIPIYGTAQALVTFIAQNDALKQEDRIRSGIRASYKILFLLTAALALGLILLNRPLLHLFTTDEEAIAYGAIMLTWEPITYVIQVVRHVQEARLRGRQRMSLYLTSSISTMAVNVIACVILVPRIGFSGFYVSSYISSFYAILISGAFVRYAKA